MDDQPQDKKTIRQRLQQALNEIKELGGWAAFKSGEWLLPLVQNAFRTYYANANADYFRKKYPRASDDEIIAKLTGVAAKNAAILGAVTGASVSANEIASIVTGTASGGLSLPAQATILGLSLASEAVLLARFQLQLIANIAKIVGVPLDPDDPEDVLVVLGFALGGAGAEAVGKFGAKAAGHLTKAAIRRQISGKALEALKAAARRIGVKLLQRSIIKYAVPIASMLIGGGWNYATTKKVGSIATDHFRKAARERDEGSKAGSKRARPTRKAKARNANAPRILQLILRREFFDAIADGTRKTEYREHKPYWTKRLDGREYDEIHFRNGSSSAAPSMRAEFRGVTTEGRGASKRYAIALGHVLEIKRRKS